MTSRKVQVAVGQQGATFRGRMVSLTVLELSSSDLEELDRELRGKMSQAPEFFRNAPLLLDFYRFKDEVDTWWLDKARRLVANNYFVPVGITGVSEALEHAAKSLDIAVWPSSGAVRPIAEENESEEDSPIPEILQDPVVEPDPVAEPEPVAMQEPEVPQPVSAPEASSSPNHQEHAETLVVRQPVRSGQKIYARGGDLLVLASVSTGAEIVADGHIHVYDTLRGRAIAGAQGKEGARIFCNDLQADLIAIAGFYTISDDIPDDKRKKAVQIFLKDEQLLIEPL